MVRRGDAEADQRRCEVHVKDCLIRLGGIGKTRCEIAGENPVTQQSRCRWNEMCIYVYSLVVHVSQTV